MTDDNDQVAIFKCAHIGVSGTTDIHVIKHDDGSFEARCGIAIMGATNMTEDEFQACGRNPFHEKFHDNFARGVGATQEEAIQALKADMRRTADSLWF